MSDLIKRQDAIEKLECFCMEKALEDQNHPSAEHHKLNIAEYIHDFYPDVWRHAEKELEVPFEELPSAPLSPCDVCIYNPPSSMDGKPCSMCPAEGRD